MELKNIIKENLLGVKLEKQNYQKSLHKLKRLQFEVYDNIFESKREKENIAMKVFNELIILESNGHYSKLINEDSWKGFPTWLWDTIKEKVIRGIINTVAPSKKDSWAANVIVTGLGDIDINEIPKLGNCEFVTTQLAKSIVEGSLEHVKRQMGFTSGISDLIRNALVETLEQGELLEKMKEKLLGSICPTIKKFGNGFESMEKNK
jgi:hypothetical protein